MVFFTFSHLDHYSPITCFPAVPPNSKAPKLGDNEDVVAVVVVVGWLVVVVT
jgi:hypothetical protein